MKAIIEKLNNLYEASVDIEVTARGPSSGYPDRIEHLAPAEVTAPLKKFENGREPWESALDTGSQKQPELAPRADALRTSE